MHALKIAPQVTIYQFILSIKGKSRTYVQDCRSKWCRRDSLKVWINLRKPLGPRPFLGVLRQTGYGLEHIAPGLLDGVLISFYLFWAVKMGWGWGSSQHLRNGAVVLGKERERSKSFLLLFSSTSNTGSVQDYFEEILEFPQLIKLWQHPGKLKANSTGHGQ